MNDSSQLSQAHVVRVDKLTINNEKATTKEHRKNLETAVKVGEHCPL